MSGFVLDSSVALAWCFIDETDAATNALIDRANAEGAAIPNLWFLEIGNVLLQAEKRGRITQPDVGARLALLMELPLAVDAEAPDNNLKPIIVLARRCQLTTYDATYLELAFRLGLPLASKDAALRAAALQIGVEVLPA